MFSLDPKYLTVPAGPNNQNQRVSDVIFGQSPHQVDSKNHNLSREKGVSDHHHVLHFSHFFISHEIDVDVKRALFRTGGEIYVKPTIDFLHSSSLVWKDCCFGITCSMNF